MKTILRQETNLNKKNQEELIILEKFVKLQEKGPEEKLQNEIKKFQDAKGWFSLHFFVFLSKFHGNLLKL